MSRNNFLKIVYMVGQSYEPSYMLYSFHLHYSANMCYFYFLGRRWCGYCKV